jgi:membrane protease subunit HflC
MSLLVLGVVAVLFITVVVSGRAGFVEVKDTEAALVVNYLTGEREVIVRPGYQIFVPVIQQAFIFDKSPQEFVMQGDKDVSANHVAKLTVRANDGSNFWFDEIKIQYELNQDRTDYVLEDSGPGEGFKQNWVRAYARSLLRDEFGKFSAIDVADPTAFKTATMEAERLLNEMLDPHGVHILQIITPRPKFEENYERAIEDRKVANQEVEKLKTRAEQLIQERERRLAEIDSKRAVEFEALKGELEARRIDAERDQVRTERSADAYQAQRVGEGQATKAALLAEAGGLTDKARKEAEGLRAITAALEKGGEVLVRERLAQLLGEVEFELIPYNRDPSPTRIELLQDTAATTALQGGH